MDDTGAIAELMVFGARLLWIVVTLLVAYVWVTRLTWFLKGYRPNTYKNVVVISYLFVALLYFVVALTVLMEVLSPIQAAGYQTFGNLFIIVPLSPFIVIFTILVLVLTYKRSH